MNVGKLVSRAARHRIRQIRGVAWAHQASLSFLANLMVSDGARAFSTESETPKADILQKAGHGAENARLKANQLINEAKNAPDDAGTKPTANPDPTDTVADLDSILQEAREITHENLGRRERSERGS
jgi:hypothetical protein